ncbi:MAG: hypothetical protein KY467_02150 [Gemmatimonadetes bacterium]|nr:hypothetical protein [Gemmatimonadota bacterium]
MKTLALTTALFAGLFATQLPAAAAQERLEGTWRLERHQDGVQLTLFGAGFGIWGRTFGLTVMQGLAPGALAAEVLTPVAFRMEREPGVFAMQGTFRDGRGTGRYEFLPDAEYGAMLRSLEIAQDQRVTCRTLMTIAFFGNAPRETVRELAGMGFPRLSLAEVIEMAVHGVTPDYVRAMRAAGVPARTSAADFAEMRTHGVTPEYVRGMGEVGYRGLTPGELVNLRLGGVTPVFVRELREAGLRDLSPDELMRLRHQPPTRQPRRGG